MLYLITGASRGLGYEYTKELLKKDAEAKVIAAARNPDSAQQLQELAQANKGRLETVKLDVTSTESVNAAIEAISKLDIARDGLDVLVNNAGILDGDFHNAIETSIEDFQSNLNTNVIGVARVTLAALPLLRKGQGKRIFVVGSIVGSFASEYSSMPMAATYSVSKTAVHMWTKKLALALGQEWVCVPLHPGYVSTEMNATRDASQMITPQEAGEKGVALIKKLTPKDSGKLWSYEGHEMEW